MIDALKANRFSKDEARFKGSKRSRRPPGLSRSNPSTAQDERENGPRMATLSNPLSSNRSRHQKVNYPTASCGNESYEEERDGKYFSKASPRMFLSGVQFWISLDSHLKHAGMTVFGLADP
jgi:hypothetical protein